MIIIGDYVKSLFNGVISRVTLNGDEPANTVAVDIANDPQMFRLATYSEINHLSEGEWMAICGNPLQYCIKKETISKELMKLVLNKPRIKDIYKLKSNPNLDDFSLPYSLHGDGDLYEINVYVLADICKEWASFNKYDIQLHRRLDKKWDWVLEPRPVFASIAGVDDMKFKTLGVSDSSYQAIFDACKHLLMHTRNR